MEVVWLGTECDKSPGGAHYLVSVYAADGGDVYCCKYCWKVKWLSNSKDGAEQMTRLMTKHGDDVGYQKLMDLKPESKEMLYKLQNIWMLVEQLDKDDLKAIIDMAVKEVSNG